MTGETLTQLWLTLALCSLLTAGWLWFFIRHDRHPEPLWLLARTFGWGVFAWLISATFEASFERWWSLPLLLTLLAAITEEGFKLVAAGSALAEPAFDEPMDGLVYAVTAALGFAYAENLTYALGFGSGVAAWHMLVTTLAHALFSAPQGYALGRYYLFGRSWWRSWGLGLSILLHFAFNTLLLDEAGWVQLLFLLSLLLLMALMARQYYRQFQAYAQAKTQ
ncbi:PrsW family intramembrane metalloprotease [Deinococcus sp. Marseille-Q6407]|uniref:PrsW family intramembrane metalloprotease n=1 Tax=Deinococcus sp. Marseille-Q6407 TaxID=2969223 RepID=UPI0021C0CB9B|nr:PrsW family glutamic-type intramembrane protease [Deinococcus sp. Marseille-Q6407]